MYDWKNTDRDFAMLTKKDRQFLLSDGTGYNTDDKHNRKRSISSRFRDTLTDFKLLSEELSSEWRNEIFDIPPRTDEYWNLERDVSATIEFLYIGMGGEARFNKPLKNAVSKGEVALGNIDTTLQVDPKFALEPYTRSDPGEVAKLIEAREWDRLQSRQLYRFIRTALSAGAIDFERIEEYLEPPVTDEFTLKMDQRSDVSDETINRLQEKKRSDETLDETINRILDSSND